MVVPIIVLSTPIKRNLRKGLPNWCKWLVRDSNTIISLSINWNCKCKFTISFCKTTLHNLKILSYTYRRYYKKRRYRHLADRSLQPSFCIYEYIYKPLFVTSFNSWPSCSVLLSCKLILSNRFVVLEISSFGSSSLV